MGARQLLCMGLLALLTACGTGHNRELHSELVARVERNDLDAALEIVRSENFFPEERSLLLRQLETATTYYRAGMLSEALGIFNDARRLSDQLFTRSVSAMLAGAVIDPNLAEFHGARYERSKIRFYQSLIHFKLSFDPELSAQERGFHRNASQNVLREWHSIFPQFRLEADGRPLFQADMMELLWGAFIHEQTGVAADRQIALILYRRARDVLFRNFNIYPAFNARHGDFIRYFERFETMDRTRIESDFVEPTHFGTELRAFIDHRIERLGRREERDNVILLVEDGLVAPKRVREERIPFNIGYALAADPGMVAWAIIALPHFIVYEVPYITPREIPRLEAVMVTATGEHLPMPLVLASPISDIAVREVEAGLFIERAAIIARLIAAYTAAAASSYLVYTQMIANNDTPMGRLIAMASAMATFRGLEAGIRATNRADLRQWRLLPSNLRLGSARFDPGEYTLKILKDTKVIYTRAITIGPDTSFISINLPEA